MIDDKLSIINAISIIIIIIILSINSNSSWLCWFFHFLFGFFFLWIQSNLINWSIDWLLTLFSFTKHYLWREGEQIITRINLKKVLFFLIGFFYFLKFNTFVFFIRMNHFLFHTHEQTNNPREMDVHKKKIDYIDIID